jgi:glucose/arabinose dehydrogenase
VRFPYKAGDLKAESATPQVIVPDIPGYAQLRGGGHWTRDVVFSADGRHMLVSVGSGSNIDDPDTHPREFHRADVLEYTPDGKFVEVYAHGIRNCVGEAINPTTGQLWCSTNERDQLGNNLPPDYVTHIEEGGFYGWPWYYLGNHKDPRLPQPCADGSGPNPQLSAPISQLQAMSCKHVDISSKVLVPDVLLQPHMASLEETFYPTSGGSFPAEFSGSGFAAEHGSWNRKNRGGYEVILFPMKDGKATGAYEDFLTGFVTADGNVWGRPVGVAVGQDGALYVTDDGSRTIWRVVYTGK